MVLMVSMGIRFGLHRGSCKAQGSHAAHNANVMDIIPTVHTYYSTVSTVGHRPFVYSTMYIHTE